MSEKLWERKRVFVTGADGFLGSHLIEKLVTLNADVTALIRGTSQNNSTTYPILKNLKDIKKINLVYGDISNPDIMNLIKKSEPEHLFHLGAIAHTDYSFEHPIEVFQTNVMGTLYILEVCRNENINSAVFTSSSEVYGTALQEKINEEHPLNPATPYAASKVAADRLVFSYHKTYGLPVSIIRPFNFFGPRLIYDVIPKFIQLALRNEPLTIHGTGEQSRDWTYVDDTVKAFLLMCINKIYGTPINIGTGNDTKIIEVANKTKELIPESKSEIVFIEDRKGQVKKLICDNSLAKEKLGWVPEVSFDEGLKKTIEWWKKK